MAGRPKRFFRRVGPEQQQAIIEHKFGRFPMVDVYELLPIAAGGNGQFFLYYGHEELDSLQPTKKIARQLLGTSLGTLLDEYAVDWKDENSLGDVVNDFFDAFFSLPAADDMDHKKSTWINDHLDRTVGELKGRDEWDDIRWYLSPNKIVVGGTAPKIKVEHLSFDALKVTSEEASDFNLMILLAGPPESE